jgi:hypothetical protein
MAERRRSMGRQGQASPPWSFGRWNMNTSLGLTTLIDYCSRLQPGLYRAILALLKYPNKPNHNSRDNPHVTTQLIQANKLSEDIRPPSQAPTTPWALSSAGGDMSVPT